ncbi:MAG TPA: hypothetical protein VL242_48170, partial [Sorangium sp.]|nr:hypothetical protein [Sorangium sp.]
MSCAPWTGTLPACAGDCALPGRRSRLAAQRGPGSVARASLARTKAADATGSPRGVWRSAAGGLEVGR